MLCVASTVMVAPKGSSPALNTAVRLSAEREADEVSRLSLLNNANAVPPLIVDGVTDLLKVTDTWVKGPTLVVPLAGVTETTVNGVVSAVLAVVKLLPKKARLPATSATLFT